MKQLFANLTSFALAAACLALLCATPASLRAGTITVTSTADSGPGSLREALASAADGDTVDATGVSGTITLLFGQLSVSNSVTILGPGPDTLTVSGNNASRVFDVTGANVTISGLTIANGYGPVYGAGIKTAAAGGSVAIIDCVITNNSTTLSGGGIFNSPGVAMTVSNCTLAGNVATNGYGGGIYNDDYAGGTTLTVIASTLSDNRAAYDGGGIYNTNATLTVSNSAICGNSAGGSGGGIFNIRGTLAIITSTLSGNSAIAGGGIFNERYSGHATMTISASTFSNNAAHDGGGIFNDGYSGSTTMTISASTFSGNSASYGGGICNDGEEGNAALTINASTVNNNSAEYGAGIYNDGFSGNATLAINASTFSGNSGESIYNYGASGSATLEIGDTILNAAASGTNIYNNAGTVTSSGYNLSSDDGGGFLANSTDLVNTDPLLGPLQDNGGPTFTHALLPGSPAIDKGKREAVTNLVSDTDQRGLGRPVDNPNLANAAGGDGSDIGAFEVQSNKILNTADSGPGSLRDALAGAADGDTIDATGVSGTIALTSGQLQVSKSVIVLGPGSASLTVSGNDASRVLLITGTNVTISGLTIANGHGALYGAGIMAGCAPGGSAAIINCVITNNSTTLHGGGIWNNPGVTLTVSNCTIVHNLATATSGRGGGMYSLGTVTVISSTFSGNSASGLGGGIYSYQATLTINASTFSGNSASSLGGGGLGGGIYSYQATLTINASTFSGNSAWDGGGIFDDGNSGPATVAINASTFSGNSARDRGGDIYSYHATVTINASTFSGNSASGLGGGIFNNGDNHGHATVAINASTFSGNSATQSGGDIYNYGVSGSATLAIGDTILNAAASGTNIYNNAGTVTSSGYNLSSDNGGGFLTNSTDLVNTDPLLGPLQDNGGPTFTHALLPGSPAIDKGKRDAIPIWALASDTDQRGFPRPIDNPSLANAAGGDGSDIGAFEAPLLMTVAKLQAKVNFNPAKSNADSCKLTGTVDLGAGFNPSNKVMTVDIGGVQVSFTLDAKGRGTTGKSTCKLSFDKKTRLWKLKVSLKNGSWAAPWADYGVTNATTPKEGVTVTLSVTGTIGDEPFGTEKSLLYKATANKSGTAK